MENLTLVVMAAGMGSRFGGPKQITAIGPSGEFIIDYSIYDAIRAGYTKIFFVIRKEHEEIFHNTIEKRVGDRIKIAYAYQELDNLPEDSHVPSSRTKPLGTAYAVLCAKPLIEGPFAIINADDFYGQDAYQKVATFLKNNSDPHKGVMISYPIVSTTSNYGSVKRGVIDVQDSYVTEITECSIDVQDNIAYCHPLSGGADFTTTIDHPVSMNLFGFNENFMDLLETDFQEFIHKDPAYLEETEIFLPDTVKKNIKNGQLKLQNIVSTGTWAGLTYKEDLPEFEEKIHNLINQHEYPTNLWTTD